MTAMIAQTPSAPDHRDIELWTIIAVMMRTGCGVFHPYLYGACLAAVGLDHAGILGEFADDPVRGRA